VSLSWIVVASLTPLGRRPWPIGSTDGSIWSVVFGFNGTDRLRTHASAAALAFDPPGFLRFFGMSGRGYATTLGTMLLAALLLGSTAAVVALARRRGGGGRIDRLPLAGGVFFGTWLVLGVGLLSHMQRLQPRYLEAVTPVIAAVIGVGIATLVAARSRAVATRAALAVSVAATAVGGVLLVHPPAVAAAVAVVAAGACAVVAAAWPRRGGPLAVLALVAVLAVPAAAAVTVAGGHKSDAGLPLHTAGLAPLSAYLIAHQGHARYEVASPNVDRAAPLITQDARPVLMLTSLYGRPLLTAAQLQHLVATGQVRYALLGHAPCTPTGCAAVIRWTRTHSVDVSAAARQPAATLFRLTAARAR
jgi:hypothetical protein